MDTPLEQPKQIEAPASAAPKKNYPTTKYKAVVARDPYELMEKCAGRFIERKSGDIVVRELKLGPGWAHTLHFHEEFPMKLHSALVVNSAEEEATAIQNGFDADFPDGRKAVPGAEQQALDAAAEVDRLKAELETLKAQHAEALKAATKQPAVTVSEEPKPPKAGK